MVRPPVRAASIAAAALLLLGAGAARAFNPQPDPPGFGMFGITELQRAHLHVALPAVQKSDNRIPPPCRVEVSFVNEAGDTVMVERHTLMPGQTGTAIFTPTRTIPTDSTSSTTEAGLLVPAVRHQLRAVVNPLDSTLPPGPCNTLVATVQVDNQQGGAPTLTLSPRDPASGLPTGKRSHKPITHLFGPLAIGFGHTARLNAANVGTGDGCQVTWTLLGGAGQVLATGVAAVPAGQAIHADFAHTDATRGLEAVRAEVTVNEGDSGDKCPGGSLIGTLEGFDSTLGHSHSIVGSQLVVPAVQ
jgi:hypothetical protein